MRVVSGLLRAQIRHRGVHALQDLTRVDQSHSKAVADRTKIQKVLVLCAPAP